MNYKKLKASMNLVAQALFAERRIQTPVEDALELLYTINPDVKSSCWIETKPNVILWGGMT